MCLQAANASLDGSLVGMIVPRCTSCYEPRANPREPDSGGTNSGRVSLP
jgi:hypothetical protein